MEPNSLPEDQPITGLDEPPVDDAPPPARPDHSRPSPLQPPAVDRDRIDEQ